jgi:riboflavin kinase/FMN adenylyltransferase
MIVYHDLPNPPLVQPSALTIGNFDGVHMGHQALIRQMQEQSRPNGWLAGLLTFDPHPVSVLRPNVPQAYLTTLAERLDLLKGIGLDYAVVYPFTAETARTPAPEFVQRLKSALRLQALWVGPDFALGRNREGDVGGLQQLGQQLGFQVHVVSPQALDGDEVRSGRIRQDLLAGDVTRAAGRLGWRYRVSGQVVRGARRGHSIGFPTANLEVPPERLLPANGVYATWAWLENKVPGQWRSIPSVTNIGVRPSFDNGQRTVETHLLDFSGDLYGQQITLEFVERLRPELRFPDRESLQAQIARDVALARTILQARG